MAHLLLFFKTDDQIINIEIWVLWRKMYNFGANFVKSWSFDHDVTLTFELMIDQINNICIIKSFMGL